MPSLGERLKSWGNLYDSIQEMISLDSNDSNSNADSDTKSERRTHHLPKSKIIVIKVGTSSICDEVTYMPKIANLSLLVETVVALRELGYRCVLVSSGAVGIGLKRLGCTTRPK